MDCRKLLGQQPKFDDLKDVHPDIYASLQKLLLMSAAEVDALELKFQVGHIHIPFEACLQRWSHPRCCQAQAARRRACPEAQPLYHPRHSASSKKSCRAKGVGLRGCAVLALPNGLDRWVLAAVSWGLCWYFKIDKRQPSKDHGLADTVLSGCCH